MCKYISESASKMKWLCSLQFTNSEQLLVKSDVMLPSSGPHVPPPMCCIVKFANGHIMFIKIYLYLTP